jgi:hypothetical protein
MRPPKIIPLAKSGGKRIRPIKLATKNRIQFEWVTNFKRRC